MDDSEDKDAVQFKNYSLIDIIDFNDLQKLQDSFAKANRIASSIVDLDGSSITRPSNYSRVCILIRETEKGSANCGRSGRILGDLSMLTKMSYCLFCQSVGFLDAATPIVVEDVHVANWLIGQNSRCLRVVTSCRMVAILFFSVVCTAILILALVFSLLVQPKLSRAY